MTDYFARLNFPRTPWLEPSEVQARFLEMSASAHPDRVHNLGAAETAAANQKFAELNEASAVLRDHKERLQHLFTLQTGKKPTATGIVQEDLFKLFGPVLELCRNVDKFLDDRARASSPMVQAQMFAEGLEWSDAVSEMQRRIGIMKEGAEEQVKSMSTDWPARKPMAELAALAYKLAVIARWESQLQERFAQLAAT